MIYKNHKIEKAEFGYHEAFSLLDCDAEPIIAKGLDNIKIDIDELTI